MTCQYRHVIIMTCQYRHVIIIPLESSEAQLFTEGVNGSGAHVFKEHVYVSLTKTTRSD